MDWAILSLLQIRVPILNTQPGAMRWRLWKVIRPRGSGFCEWDLCPCKKRHENLLGSVLSSIWGCRETAAIYKPESESDIICASVSTWSFLDPATVANECQELYPVSSSLLKTPGQKGLLTSENCREFRSQTWNDHSYPIPARPGCGLRLKLRYSLP